MAERTCISFKVLIGLEVHVQLATKSKMFTSAPNGFGGEPNTQVDPVVLGLPGSLPVMNRKAVEYSIKVGMALGCEIARFSKWDRKSYYYPDLPKNYQISQYDLPLCGAGVFEIALRGGGTKTVRIRRAHLEEDAGKLLHEAPGGHRIDHSIVDLNRAGTPLLEIVTEPDLSSGEEVATFGQELQKLVRYLGVSEAQMQMGHMRFEPNINVHITVQNENVVKTAITEIKNLNSFSVLQRATDFEIQRQIREWEDTGKLGRKSTMGWDESTGSTFLQREKEEAHDYRYFPDPDLVPVVVNDAWLGELKGQIGELPAARRKRYVEVLGLPEKEAAPLLASRATGDFFDAVVGQGVEAKRAANLIEALRSVKPGGVVEDADVAGIGVQDRGVSASQVAGVALLIASNKIAANKETVQKVLGRMAESGESAEKAAEGLGLLQVSDTGAIDAAIDALIAENPKSLQDYRGGKQAALGSLVGMIMKGGKGLNAKMVQERLRKRLTSWS